jgi:hypothetical protein
MAVHEPCTWVVRLERKHKIALRGKRGCVAADRIISLETGDVTRPSSASLLVKDVEVVTMQMDRVWKWWSCGVLLNDPVLPLFAYQYTYI